MNFIRNHTQPLIGQPGVLQRVSQTGRNGNTSTCVQSVYPCISPEQKLGKPQQHSCIPASTTTPRKKRSRNGNKKKQRKARGVTLSGAEDSLRCHTSADFFHLGVLSLLASCCPLLRGAPGKQTQKASPDLSLDVQR